MQVGTPQYSLKGRVSSLCSVLCVAVMGQNKVAVELSGVGDHRWPLPDLRASSRSCGKGQPNKTTQVLSNFLKL